MFSFEIEIISIFLTLFELFLKGKFSLSSSSCYFPLIFPRVDDYYFNVTNKSSFVLGIEGKGKCIGKYISIIREELPISFSLNQFPLSHEVFLKGSKSLLDSSISHVSILGAICAMSPDGNFFFFHFACLSANLRVFLLIINL